MLMPAAPPMLPDGMAGGTGGEEVEELPLPREVTMAVPAPAATAAKMQITTPPDTAGAGRLVCETLALASNPSCEACTLISYLPAVEFSRMRGITERPLASVAAMAALEPVRNVPPGPLAGSRKTTVAPATGWW